MQDSADFTAFAWITTHPWLYPALASLHIVGIALLLGSLVLLELRVWGIAAALPVAPLARLSGRLSLLGFALAVLTGVVMFVGQPAEWLASRVFVAKMALLMLAGLNAAAFHARGGLDKLDRFARLQTLLSLGLWLAVIGCGRWLDRQ